MIGVLDIETLQVHDIMFCSESAKTLTNISGHFLFDIISATSDEGYEKSRNILLETAKKYFKWAYDLYEENKL